MQFYIFYTSTRLSRILLPLLGLTDNQDEALALAEHIAAFSSSNVIAAAVSAKPTIDAVRAKTPEIPEPLMTASRPFLDFESATSDGLLVLVDNIIT